MFGKAKNLPSGWRVARLGSRGDKNRVNYYYDRDSLHVFREGIFWVLTHNGRATEHKFKTAADAIEYADDAAKHGG